MKKGRSRTWVRRCYLAFVFCAFASWVYTLFQIFGVNHDKNRSIKNSKHFLERGSNIPLPQNSIRLHELQELVRLDHIPETKGQKFFLTICVITFDRPKSLKRLLNSLLQAKYFDHSVDLTFSIDTANQKDSNKTEKVLELAHGVRWPYGKKKIRRRQRHGGLVTAVIESWYPVYDNEFYLFAEDDIELSPLWYEWASAAIEKYRIRSKFLKFSGSIAGISLYTNRLLETVWPYQIRHIRDITNSTAVLYQLPCSWGGIYFPEHWKMFREYALLRSNAVKNVLLEHSTTNGWEKSWVKYMHELLYLQSWTLLYPNFPDEMSFATNHIEPGVHIDKKRSVKDREKYTVPLLDSGNNGLVTSNQFPHLSEIPIFDMFLRRHTFRSIQLLVRRVMHRKSIVCKEGKRDCLSKIIKFVQRREL